MSCKSFSFDSLPAEPHWSKQLQGLLNSRGRERTPVHAGSVASFLGRTAREVQDTVTAIFGKQNLPHLLLKIFIPYFFFYFHYMFRTTLNSSSYNGYLCGGSGFNGNECIFPYLV